ncbi:MAG: hypothetical protein PVI59_17920, partial [Anaerolineae bacterium]
MAPHAEIDGYLRLHADVDAIPWWQLYGGLDAKVGAKAEIFGRTLLDYQPPPWQLYEELLAQAPVATTTRVSVSSEGEQGNSSSHNPSISADGRYVAFDSGSSNLVSNDTNGCSDVFVR